MQYFRCELDAAQQGSNNETQFVNLKALNEWDSRHSGNVDWRQKLGSQPGACLANELKNNACKLAKWTVQVRRPKILNRCLINPHLLISEYSSRG